MDNNINIFQELKNIKYLTKFQQLQVFISGCCGMLLSISNSFFVNSSLIEISFNNYFAMTFGFLFFWLGISIIYKVQYGNQSQLIQQKKKFLQYASIMIMISGALCFFLDKNIFQTFSTLQKVPLYSILGISVSFTVVFTMIDVINCILIVLNRKNLHKNFHPKGIVDSNQQINYMLIFSCLTGCIYGFIFGALGIENTNPNIIYFAFMKDRQFCYPFAAVLGYTFGCINEIIRLKNSETQYESLPTYIESFNDEI